MLKDKAKKRRWEESSRFEREWWTKWKSGTDLNLVRRELIERAKQIKTVFDPYFPSDLRKILQIGPGANAEIHFLSGDRFAIDPLASYFKENFSGFIDPRVDFIEGMAEELPYPDSFFDVILILNVLDHCWEPLTVVDEIARCLRSNGILILQVNIYKPTALVLHFLFQFLDREHSHALTYRFIKSHLRPHFEILEESWLPLNLPEQNKLKKALSVILKIFLLFPSTYKGVFKKR
jgi:SAM-dependent methyltransferase